eukprot:gene14605-17258_t
MNRDFRRQDIFKAIDSKYCIATNDNERVDLVSQNIDDAVYLSERYFPKMLKYFTELVDLRHEIHTEQYTDYSRVHSKKYTTRKNTLQIVEPSSLHISTWAAFVTEFLPNLESIRIAEEHLLAEEAPEQVSQSDENLQKAAEETAPSMLNDESLGGVGSAEVPTQPVAKGDAGSENDEEGTAVEVEDDDKAEEDDDEAAEKDNEDAGKEEAEEGDEGEDEEEGEEDVGGDAMGPGTPQRSSKAPKRAITSFVMEHDEEIVFPSKTPKTAEENEEYEKEKQAARRK